MSNETIKKGNSKQNCNSVFLFFAEKICINNVKTVKKKEHRRQSGCC